MKNVLKFRPKLTLDRLSKLFFIVWLCCLVLVFSTIVYVVKIRNELFDKAPDIFVILLVVLVVIGCVAFLIASIILAISVLRKTSKNQGIIVFLIKLFLVLTILPLFLLIYYSQPLKLIRKLRQFGLKGYLNSMGIKTLIRCVSNVLFASLVMLPIWVAGYSVVGTVVLSQFGYATTDIGITGTGSMYPTWPKGTKGKSRKELANEIISASGFIPYPNGIVLGKKRLFGHILGRGDIIIWDNDATRNLTSQDGADPGSLVKRLIGLPGDTIELKDGLLYLNGEAQKEPYIAEPHSTFGEKFLKECQKVTVPQGLVFAMGDNRKGSSDSREIGFAPIKDIKYVIPLSKQIGKLDKNWHDATNDITEASKPKIDKKRFLELLNSKRLENGSTELKYQSKLEKSALLRGEVILKTNDFEQKDAYTMERSMADAGYWNTYWWEVSIQGYYGADELIENYLENDETDAKKIWMDKKFDDIGIAEVEGTLNGCPTQVIVIHVAGYIPPDYTNDFRKSWKTVLSQLKDIQPGWAKLKTYPDFYQENKKDVNRINEIISIRINNVSAIVARIEANQWLTATEQRFIDQDQSLFDEQEIIAKRLNSH